MTDPTPTSGRVREVPRPFKLHDGRFQRSPMMLDGTDSLEGMRAALQETPRLRALLKKLLS